MIEGEGGGESEIRTAVEVRANEEESRRVRANAERAKQRSAAAAGDTVCHHGTPSSLELIAEQLQKLEVD